MDTPTHNGKVACCMFIFEKRVNFSLEKNDEMKITNYIASNTEEEEEKKCERKVNRTCRLSERNAFFL